MVSALLGPQELDTTGIRMLPVLGHGRLPGVPVGSASLCAARFWQGRVMGLEPRQWGLEQERRQGFN